MKIGIDISQVVVRGSGVARFTDGLVTAICAYDTDNEWHFFFSSLRQSLPDSLDKTIATRGFRLHKYPFPPSLLSRIWNTYHTFDIQHLTGPLDWIITSDWTEPPATCKKATIIHDLSYVRFPETVDESIRATQASRIRHVKKETDRIFADSHATTQDIEKYLSIPSNQVTVNYPGLAQPIKTDKPLHPAVNRPFILTVGKREPRKNIEGLIEAYKMAQPDGIDLVIAGDKGWGTTAGLTSSSDRIHFLGYVSDEELSVLYAKCVCFAFPSLWEGFGYPVLEAMQYGAPVITSDTSSLGEIARNAALLVNPQSTSEIAGALTKLVSSEPLRNKLSAAGKAHVKQFTWKRYYETMMKDLV